MQVFNTYFKIFKKQRVPILIYTGLFLGLVIMFASNMSNNNNQFVNRKVKTMVINEDGQSAFVDGFLNYMDQYVIFVEAEKDKEAVKDALYNQKAVYILTIPEGFSEDFLENREVTLTKQTAPNSMEAITVDSAVNNYLKMARTYLNYVPEINYDELNTYVEQNLKETTEVAFDVKVKDAVSEGNNFNSFYFTTLGYIIVAGFITGVSIVMFSFHGVDTRRKHAASPLKESSLNAQLIFANLIFVMGYLLLFIIAGYILNKNRVLNINTVLFWINAIVFALTALSISYLVGISVKSKKAIGAISTALSLSLAFISGIFVPQQYLGAPVLKVASFTPTYWYVKANNTIVTITTANWDNISEIIGYMAIQLGFAAAIISIALVVSKRKRQQAF